MPHNNKLNLSLQKYFAMTMNSNNTSLFFSWSLDSWKFRVACCVISQIVSVKQGWNEHQSKTFKNLDSSNAISFFELNILHEKWYEKSKKFCLSNSPIIYRSQKFWNQMFYWNCLYSVTCLDGCKGFYWSDYHLSFRELLNNQNLWLQIILNKTFIRFACCWYFSRRWRIA